VSRGRVPLALLLGVSLGYVGIVGLRTAAEARRSAGEALLWSGDAEGAAAHFTGAAALDPLGTAGFVGEADALFEQAELSRLGSPAQLDPLERAIAAYRRALARNPGDPAAWAQLGRAYRSLAVAHRASQPIDIAKLDQVASLREPEDDLAISALVRAIEIEPHNYDYVNYLAEMRYAHGDPEALADYRRGTLILPRLLNHPYLQERTVPDDIMAAALQGARDALGTGNVVPDYKILEDISLYLASRGKYEAALGANLESIRAGNNYPAWLWTRQGVWLAHLGRRAEARQALAEALRIDPERPSAHFMLGRLETADGNVDAALASLARARDLAPDDLEFQMELARTFDQADRFEAAEREYERAIHLPGGAVPATTALVSLLSRHGVLDRALVHARRLLEEHPNEPAFRKQVAELTARLTF
jgi:tetratricopeptide (TPR) repeat protein